MIGEHGHRGRHGLEDGEVRVLRGLVATAVATTVSAVALLAGAGTAQADQVDVVPGARFPTPETYLTYVACQSFGGESTPPVLRITLGPATPPLGRRSAGLVPSGPGTATGAFFRLRSMATGTAVVPVHAAEGTTGVSYAWVQAADAPPGHAWLGRAEVGVPAAQWTEVDAAALTYTWSLVDLLTGVVVAQTPGATLPAFTAEHGDGVGYVALGFGCDGHPFHLDAVRGGDAGAVTTYDVEGLVLTTAMTASTTRVTAGEEVTLTATVTDVDGRVTGDSVVLEARRPGGAWQPVGDGETVLAEVDGLAHTTVAPEATTDYRWYRPEGPYADEGWSAPLRVVVVAPR